MAWKQRIAWVVPPRVTSVTVLCIPLDPDCAGHHPAQLAFTPLTLTDLQSRHCHHPTLQGQKTERLVNMPKVSEQEWEAQGSALQPFTHQR